MFFDGSTENINLFLNHLVIVKNSFYPQILSLLYCSLPLTIMLFKWLRSITGNNLCSERMDYGLLCMAIAGIALYFKKESLGQDLNFVEV